MAYPLPEEPSRLRQIFRAQFRRGIGRYLPEGPVRSRPHSLRALSGARYVEAPWPMQVPALPARIWALATDYDIIVVTDHPDWDMHEFGVLQTPEGKVWVVRDARAGSLNQVAIADVGDIDAWFPEIYIERKASAIEVVDRSTARKIDVALSYQNGDHQEVRASYRGPALDSRWSLQRKRNGSTMGHSAGELLVTLDIPRRRFGHQCSVSYDGERYRPSRLLGLKPFQMALSQSQAGLSTGLMRQTIASSEKSRGMSVELFTPSGSAFASEWVITDDGQLVTFSHENDLRTLRYRFLKASGSLEFCEAEVQQWNHDTATARLQVYPSLPDLSRRFDGVVESEFWLEVGGQPAHAHGKVEATYAGETATLRWTPLAPWWVEERPMTTRVTRAVEDVQLRTLETNTIMD